MDGNPQPVHRPAIPPIRSLSVGARHRASAGGAAKAGCRSRPSSSSSTSPSQPWLSAETDRASISTCPQPTSNPAGAHADASASVNRTVR